MWSSARAATVTYHTLGGFNNGNLLLTVLEARRPRSRGWLFPEASSGLAGGRLPSVSSRGHAPLCAVYGSISLFMRTLVITEQGPP